jgi:hypothetical protein
VTAFTELLHHLLVDVEPARRVDDDDVTPLSAGLLETLRGNRNRIALASLCIDGDLDLLSELLQLVDRSRSLKVAGDESGCLPLLAQEESKLGCGGRLTRALQTGEEDDRRRTSRERKLRAPGPHERRQLLVHDLHDLLTRREALQHLGTRCTLLHRGDELLDDLEVDVGLEQRESDLTGRPGQVLVGKTATAGQVAESGLELVGEGVEHAGAKCSFASARGYNSRARAARY